MLARLALVLVAGVAAENQDLTSPPVYPGLPTVKQLAAEGGTTCTDILVTTDDGYLLWIHRIGNNSGPPVLLQHGLFNAADLWINRGPEEDLSYLLLRDGYDVYLGNFRGNANSLNHIKYNRADPRFWNFSFHEHGYYDVPAMIDKILKLRRVKQVYYVGFSMGTTAFLVMTSSRPEYNDKIKAAMLLSPVGYGMSRIDVLIVNHIIQHYKTVEELLKMTGFNEVFPRAQWSIQAVQAFCSPKSAVQEFCMDTMGRILGENRNNVNKDTLGYLLSFTPAGTSRNTLVHLAQNYKQKTFNYLDFGDAENLKRYGSTQVPSYNVSRITCPVGMFWGKNDKLVSKTAVYKLAAEMPNLLFVHQISDPLFNHADFVLGMNSKQLVYVPVVKAFNKIRRRKWVTKPPRL